MKTITIICALLLSGCYGTYSSARIAVLQNPETKQTVECKVEPWGDMNTRRQVDNCIGVYQKAGYRLVADSAD